MRVALAAEGSRGDIYPMLDLAHALEAHGHQVVICAPPDFAPVVAARGFPFRPIAGDVHEFMVEHAAAITGGGLAALRAVGSWLRATMARQFEALPDAVSGADVLVCAGTQLAGASVAELLGIPYRYVVYCPGLLPTLENPPMTLPVASLPRWLNRLAWPLHTWLTGRMVSAPLDAQRQALGLAPIGDPTTHLLSARPLVAAERALAPIPSDCPLDAQQIGCLHTPDPEPLPEKLVSFLEQGPAPVYLGFGSMTDPHPGATTRLLLDAIESVGCRAIISQGWAGLGDGPLPDGVFHTGAVSHPALFPRCAAIVHHGGAGTTTAAARAGAPQIVVPHVADQFYWGERVRRLGVGAPQIRRRRLTSSRLAEALRESLQNETLAERARDIAARLSTSRPLTGDPATWL